MDAHRAAVDTALDYVQQHAAYSRAGVNGVRQVDTQGLIIAGFEHRMSREQDPNIHTHAVVANRVLCADGRWRTVDGRAVYAASVGARAVYEQALETELAQRLGVRFSVDERRTIREVHGIPLAVIELFSKRRTAIARAMTGAIDGELTAAGGWRQTGAAVHPVDPTEQDRRRVDRGCDRALAAGTDRRRLSPGRAARRRHPPNRTAAAAADRPADPGRGGRGVEPDPRGVDASPRGPGGQPRAATDPGGELRRPPGPRRAARWPVAGRLGAGHPARRAGGRADAAA